MLAPPVVDHSLVWKPRLASPGLKRRAALCASPPNHANAVRGSAACCAESLWLSGPRLLPSSSSAPAERLSLPAGAEEVGQDTRATERRSLSAQRAAEPQVAARRSERDLDKHGAPPRGLAQTSFWEACDFPKGLAGSGGSWQWVHAEDGGILQEIEPPT
jgi:hypothetical protein